MRGKMREPWNFPRKSNPVTLLIPTPTFTLLLSGLYILCLMWRVGIVSTTGRDSFM